MTIVGISFSTLVQIFFWGWVSGIVTFIAGLLLIAYFNSKNKKS